MKNLFSLLCLVVLLGVSASVTGQNTGRAPSVGSEHTYAVTPNATSTFAWTVTVEATGIGVNLLTAGAVVSGDGSTDNDIVLTWLNPVVSPATTYYVHVIESAVNGCTNHKAYAVIPANNFEMDIVSLTDAYVANAINTPADYCAPDVLVLTWDATVVTTQANSQDFDYDYGTTYLYYRVEAKGIDYANVGWKPTISLTNTNVVGSTITTTWGTVAPTGAPMAAYTTFTGGTELSVAAGNQYIWIEVAVDNNKTKPLATTGNEGTTQQTVQLNLAGTDANGNTATAINSTGADNAINNIKARPNTGVIVSD